MNSVEYIVAAGIALAEKYERKIAELRAGIESTANREEIPIPHDMDISTILPRGPIRPHIDPDEEFQIVADAADRLRDIALARKGQRTK